MHGCVISTMFGQCLWFFKKTFLFKQLSIPTPPVLHISHSGSLTRWSPPSCIMHGCVISTMFGWCFWFFKKTFLFKQLSIPTPPVLHISHSGSLTRRSPLSPRSFAFFTPSTPLRSILCISHSDSLTCRSRQVVVAVVDDTYYKITTTNYISNFWARVTQHSPAHHPSTGCLNTGFHQITVGQSERLQGRLHRVTSRTTSSRRVKGGFIVLLI